DKTSGRNHCGGKGAVTAAVSDGCILDISTGCGIGDPEIRSCVRGRSYRKTYMDPRRLRYPMARRGKRGQGLFRRISWSEAAELASAELKRLSDKYGPGCRMVIYGTGITGLMRPGKMVQRMLNLCGGSLGYYGTYSSINAEEATPYIYGDDKSGNSNEDLYNTNYLILWGHNPVTTIMGSQRRKILVDLKARGTKIVVIDPRRSDSAIALADEWIGIEPSTDGALADAMAYTISSEGLQDQRFMDHCCLGFDAEHMPEGVPAWLNYHDYLFGVHDGIAKTPEWAEKITGIPAETIRRIAIEYATAKPACLLPGLGNQRTGNGEQTTRGLAALCCLTGNVGIPGGGAAGANMVIEEPRPAFPTGQSDYKGAISCFLWTQAIREGHLMTRSRDHIKGMEQLDSDLKFIFNFAGNTLVNQHSDINDTINTLADDTKCEFIVTSDVFMTPSARYSDLLLPGSSFLEEDDINSPWIYGHYLLAGNRAISPVFGCRSEYGFIADMARHMGVFEDWSQGCPDRSAHLRMLYEKFTEENSGLGLPDFDTFMENGGHTYEAPKTYIAYKEQTADPEQHPFNTPSGKIEIVSQRLWSMHIPEIPAHPGYVPCREGPADPLREKYPLQLIGYHTKRRCHSIHDNNPLLEETDPQQLWINPADAAKRGIADGDTVRVYNERGSIRIKAWVTDRIIPGVTALSQGAWYTPEKKTDSRSCQHGGPEEIRGSINVLTGFFPTPLAKGNPQHSNLVEVTKCVD
ncbi:MAG: molybdopterin-dependent oxidoreductase, partial [Oscillospiraceae bacterium]|nr:molybdopterin-dependent oxidoreductase [Oscillospiraceae bacterium]